jgi:hypothetical protein
MNTQGVKVYFRGILANVDSSILQVDFNHGFSVESFSEGEAETFLSLLEKIPRMSVAEKYFMRYGCFNDSEHRMYVISKLLENVSNFNHSKVARFDNKMVLGYLEPTIRLMRLFKEGDIRMPVKFYHQIQNDEPQGKMRLESLRYISREPYHLEASEIPVLQSFIHSVELPFKRDFLYLAFENFELSYEIFDIELAFLVLMIGLETLLNPAHNELRYRLSRNTAVLLGEDKGNSEDIFTLVKNLYDKRSEIIHSGKRKIIKKEDILRLRDYVRRAIKEMYRIGKEKSEITSLLDSCGFGEKIEKS